MDLELAVDFSTCHSGLQKEPSTNYVRHTLTVFRLLGYFTSWPHLFLVQHAMDLAEALLEGWEAVQGMRCGEGTLTY